MLSLREECELLREEVRQLRERLGMSPPEQFFADARRHLGLQPAPAKMLSVLVAAPLAKREHLLEAMTPTDWQEREMKNVDVGIWKLRKALRPLGIEIENVWGIGYRLSEGGRSKLRELLQIDEVA